MDNQTHMRLIGIVVFIASILLGCSLIAKGNENAPCLFGGILVLAYTMLNAIIGIEKNKHDGEDF